MEYKDKEKYLVINAGSSSLKFSLYTMPDAEEIVNGYVEKIGNEDSFYTLKYNGKKVETKKEIKNHKEAINTMIIELLNNGFVYCLEDIKGVGHRVLHGGEIYSDSILIDDKVLNDIKDLTKLGPLHHPGEIAGIEAMQKVMPGIPQVAVFDTAFHQTMPEENYMYAVPYSWYKENGVRKYGFHGTSHKYITQHMKKHYKKDDVNLIICHLGSGASISCIKEGKCFDTTMGLTPLDGLVMGTRSGSIDPSIIEFISKERNIEVPEIINILNKQGGLLGISGKNDLRDVELLANNGDKLAKLSIDMMKRSIIKYIGQYYFELGGNIDSLIFTAGIGENSISIRKSIIDLISETVNIKIDDKKNEEIAGYKSKQRGIISTEDSAFDVYVVPTNEEYMILKDTYEISKNLINNDVMKLTKERK